MKNLKDEKKNLLKKMLKDVWHLRKGKKEKGGIFPLAGPLIASVGG